MKIMTNKLFLIILIVIAIITLGNMEHLGLTIPFAFAHCDTLDGPVIAEAKKALETGDVTPVLKWVREEDEPIIKDAFESTMSVRKLGPEASEVADRYFFETLVRVHRMSEGAPYTGLKPAGTGVTPAVMAADEALEKGSVKKLAREMADKLEREIEKRFVSVQEKNKHAEDSIEAGREYVEAYVRYIHFVDDIDKMIAGHGEDRLHAEHGAAIETITNPVNRVPLGQVAVSGTHNYRVTVSQNQTVQVGDTLSISVQTINLAGETSGKFIIYATISAPGKISKKFYSETGTCLSYAGYAIRVTSISTDAADFLISDEKPCELFEFE